MRPNYMHSHNQRYPQSVKSTIIQWETEETCSSLIFTGYYLKKAKQVESNSKLEIETGTRLEARG